MQYPGAINPGTSQLLRNFLTKIGQQRKTPERPSLKLTLTALQSDLKQPQIVSDLRAHRGQLTTTIATCPKIARVTHRPEAVPRSPFPTLDPDRPLTCRDVRPDPHTASVTQSHYGQCP